MIGDYEIHVTFTCDNGLYEHTRVWLESHGWKHSAIDGDPVLGDGIRHYATKHAHRDRALADVIYEAESLCAELSRPGVNVLRVKVERIEYDRKTT